MESYQINHFTFTYPNKGTPALSDVCLTIQKGEFVTLCGKSGCGKTTLLRHLKSILAPHGVKSGEILLDGQPLNSLSNEEQSERIGFVMQSPDNQIVTDKVWHELAFGLERMGQKNTGNPHAGVGDGVFFRDSDLVPQKGGGTVRWAKTTAQFGFYYGHAAIGFDFG